MESLRTSDKAAARACRAADLQNLCHIISSYKLELKPIKAFPLGFHTRSGFLVVIRFFSLMVFGSKYWWSGLLRFSSPF